MNGSWARGYKQTYVARLFPPKDVCMSDIVYSGMAYLGPIDFTTFRTSEKRTLISPRHTLANTKLPPKADDPETTPTDSFAHA